MTYNKACKKFRREVRQLYRDWRPGLMKSPLNRNSPFNSESPKEKKGDHSLEVAHKRLTKLIQAVERIQASRAQFIQ